MKRFGKLILAVVAVTFTLGLTITEAEAARFGGGKSFGASRNNSAMRQAAPPAKPAQNAAAASAPAAAAAPASGMSRWMGPIAGLAAGIGLAAMLSHFGMGEGVANLMMIALLAMAAVFLVRWLMRKREPEPRMQYAAAGPSVGPSTNFEAVPGINNGVSSSATAQSASFARPPCSAVVSEEVVSPAPTGEAEHASGSIPADFDVAGFVRQAKLNFVRLQAANDRGDLDDIRQFTAPEVFAEIQMQLQERGNSPQQTDVVQLEAELLSFETEAARHLASVRFSGQLREDANRTPQAFAEVWHLSKPTDGSRGWQIAGIQQLS